MYWALLTDSSMILSFALSTIGLVASFAFAAINVATLQTNTLLDHLHAIVAGHSVHQRLERSVQIRYRFIDQTNLLLHSLPLHLLFHLLNLVV